MFSYKGGGEREGGGGGESREKGTGVHRSARTQEVRAREACSSASVVASLAREERSGAKLKGDEEYCGEKKRPRTRTRERG